MENLDTKELLKEICIALDDKKVENMRILDLGENSSIADYFVIASGNSEAHLKGMQKGVEKLLAEKGEKTMGKINSPTSGWQVIDNVHIVVHLFSRENRDFYGMDSLWKDCTVIPFEEL